MNVSKLKDGRHATKFCSLFKTRLCILKHCVILNILQHWIRDYLQMTMWNVFVPEDGNDMFLQH
jgi:hypothetical protein